MQYVKHFYDICDSILDMKQLFGTRLKELREEKGLSQAELAKQTGLSQSAISLWEDGKRSPNAEIIIIFARFFDVTADYILGMAD